MMSECHTVLEPLYILLEDVRAVYPELHAGLVHDVDELKKRASSRGLESILIDLPAMGKLYDKGLSSGVFDICQYPSSLKRSGSKPNLFEGLLRRSFYGDRFLECIDPEPEIVFFTRCIFYLYKKYDCPPKRGSVEDSVKAFITTDEGLPEPSLDWLDPNSSYGVKDLSFLDHKGKELDRLTYGMLDKLDQVARILRFPESSPLSIIPRHGPGAVADLARGRDKYVPTFWPAKLEKVFPKAHFLSYRGDLDQDHSTVRMWPNNPHSLYGVARLHDVPKTHKGPRLITVEPTAHQFVQGGLMKWIRSNMSVHYRRSISFHDQEPSRQFALQASESGHYATVDLSEASDRLSCWVVERYVGDVSLRAQLIASRSPYVDLSRYGDSRDLLLLRKFAGMGSAVTFPIQSLFYFAAAVSAVAQWRGITKLTGRKIGQLGKEIRVFGDDICMPSSAVPYLDRLFSYLDLKVNVSKTHWKGYFRESCGMDAYRGVEVTPYYLRHSDLRKGPQALASWVDNRNVAYQKGLWSLARWFESKVPEKVSQWIVRTNQDLGALTYRSYLDSTYAKRWRWNNSHQLWECRSLRLTPKSVRVVRGNSLDLLQYFLESPGPDSFWEPGYLAEQRALIGPVWVAAPKTVRC